MELIFCPAAVIFAIINLGWRKNLWVILSWICCSLPMALSMFDINRRIASGDISGIMDIYPTLANIYLIVLALVTLLNVLAIVKKK